MLNDLQLKSILEDFDVTYWKINLLTKEISLVWAFQFTYRNPEKGTDKFEKRHRRAQPRSYEAEQP